MPRAAVRPLVPPTEFPPTCPAARRVTVMHMKTITDSDIAWVPPASLDITRLVAAMSTALGHTAGKAAAMLTDAKAN